MNRAKRIEIANETVAIVETVERVMAERFGPACEKKQDHFHSSQEQAMLPLREWHT